MIPVMAVISGAERAHGIFGRFLRQSRPSVLAMSAYAYQEGVSLVLAGIARTKVGAGHVASSARPSTRWTGPIRALSSPRSDAPAPPMMPARSTKISTARAVRPRTASASSSSCSPIAHHRQRWRPINCACRSRQWPTCWPTHCVVSACVIPSSPTLQCRPFASSCSSSEPRCAPARDVFTSLLRRDVPTRPSSRSHISTCSARSAPHEPLLGYRTPALRLAGPPTRDLTDTYGGKIAASGLAPREPTIRGFKHSRIADPNSKSAVDYRAH